MTHVLEIDEAGALTIPPELLGNALPHSRYEAVKKDGGVIVRPEKSRPKSRAKHKTEPEDRMEAWEQWTREWDEIRAQLSKAWPAGLAAADAVAEQRR